MKIHIIYDDKAEEPEITVVCRELSDEVRKILSVAEMSENKLTGVKDGQVYILRHGDVIYMDTVDKKIFIRRLLPGEQILHCGNTAYPFDTGGY